MYVGRQAYEYNKEIDIKNHKIDIWEIFKNNFLALPLVVCNSNRGDLVLRDLTDSSCTCPLSSLCPFLY